jgi:uncharacterized protein
MTSLLRRTSRDTDRTFKKFGRKSGSIPWRDEWLQKEMIERDLLRIVRKQFKLDWKEIHGVRHWARVRANGLRLAELTGAKPRIIELFAFLHDSRRMNDDFDPEHGRRAASFAETLVGSAFQVEALDLELLLAACRGHSDGLIVGDITVLTCWDADRLDLGRVGIKPNPTYLCTDAARDAGIIEWAYRRSIR